MRIPALLLLFLSSLALHSCEEDETTMARPYHLVKSVTGPLDSWEACTYDEQDRLIRVDRSHQYYALVYGEGQVTITHFLSVLEPTESSGVVALNEFGYFTSSSGATHVYNAEGNLISLRFENQNPVAIYNYEYTDGNLTRAGFASQPTNYITYTYDTDRLDKRRAGFQTLMGKPSINLVSTRTTYSNATSPKTETFNYTYDDCDRIVTETITDENGTTQSVKTFTYFD